MTFPFLITRKYQLYKFGKDDNEFLDTASQKVWLNITSGVHSEVTYEFKTSPVLCFLLAPRGYIPIGKEKIEAPKLLSAQITVAHDAYTAKC